MSTRRFSAEAIRAGFRFKTYLHGAIATLLCVFTFASRVVGIRAILGFLALVYLLLPTLRALARWLIPEATTGAQRLAVATSLIVASAYYLSNGKSTAASAFSWLVLIYGVLGLLSSAQHLLLDVVLLRGLRQDFESGKLPAVPFPLGYMTAEPGVAVLVARRLHSACAKAIHSRHHRMNYLGPFITRSTKAKTREAHLTHAEDGRAGMLWIVSDALRYESREFRSWLARHLDAYILVRTTDKAADKDFQLEVATGLRLNKGPTSEIRIGLEPPPKSIWTGAPQVCVFDQTRQITMHEAAAVISDRLAATAIPTAAADATLTPNLRSYATSICADVLPPFADCYLRVRLGRSDVERFSTLLDMIESLVRMNAIILAASALRASRDFNAAELGKATTLGGWQKRLEVLLQKDTNVDPQNGACKFWRAETFGSQVELVSHFSMVGAHLADNQPADKWSQLSWLKWLIELRNATRGHGFLTEEQFSSVWPLLHTIVLQMCYGLEDLVVASDLYVLAANDTVHRARGWQRNGVRIDGQPPRPITGIVAWRLPGHEAISISPFVQVQHNDCHVLDAVEKNGQVTYLDYTSGERETYEIGFLQSPADLRSAWHRANQVVRKADADGLLFG